MAQSVRKYTLNRANLQKCMLDPFHNLNVYDAPLNSHFKQFSLQRKVQTN